MHKQGYYFQKLLLILILLLCQFTQFEVFSQSTNGNSMALKVKSKLKSWENPFSGAKKSEKITIDSVAVSKEGLKIEVYFSKNMLYLPVRESDEERLEQELKTVLGKKFKNYVIQLYTDRKLLSSFIPNVYRKNTPVDQTRKGEGTKGRIPVVRNLDKSTPSKGLYLNNIALWHSHGYHYESKLDRWEWQRARLFGSVEDLITATYVFPYLAPMLENAGANVFLPQERDIQSNEVIVDNDGSSGKSHLEFSQGLIMEKKAVGFFKKDTLFPGENPFKMGSSLLVTEEKNKEASISFIPEIPETGDYAVTIGYQQGEDMSSGVKCSVLHTGGKSEFMINQKIGGGTWIYLGTFHFRKGKNKNIGSLIVHAGQSDPGFISIDAVRFGGGMGNVARRPAPEMTTNVKSVNATTVLPVTTQFTQPEKYQWKISGKPRYMEGARYYMQYGGMPDSSVYSLNAGKNDYNDDYQSRGAWVNYLKGIIGAGNENGNAGLHIPIDLSMAFHTDAGTTPNDSVIGTLTIYNTATDKGIFPNGQSKLANRDLADVVQTQIVEDIRNQYYPIWTRRQMWDKKYSEAVKPNVPSFLLELLSHQNLADVRLSLDPKFKFSVCRAIYKGLLKFEAFQEGRDYVVQPLPVKEFSIVPLEGKTVRISWKPETDSLEQSAKPTAYKLYKRIGENGFDNGTYLQDTSVVVELENYNLIYSFKVTALNEGGESFPGEILSAGFSGNKTLVLVVNGFNRVSAPSSFDSKDMGGISWWDDQGVADGTDFGFTGEQYDFNRKSEWLDDDCPGWGASHADMEGKVLKGNSFDFPYIHGQAILNNGYSFVSVSKEAFCKQTFSTNKYLFTDVILGEEKSIPWHFDTTRFHFTIFTPEFQKKLTAIADSGGNMFLSGAYVGTDLQLCKNNQAGRFAENILHYTWRTSHAVKYGNIYPTDDAKNYFCGNMLINTTFHSGMYTVEAPDAIEPSGKGALTAFRYVENNTSAGVSFQGKYKSLVLGYPFESITGSIQRDIFMEQILNFFKK